MKKKTMALVSSCAAIAVCSSLIVGSTYALFTSDSKVDITVKSGKVDVVATLDKTYNEVGYEVSSTLENEFVQPEFVENDNLQLNNIMPGDSVTVKIDVVNNSTVTVKYRASVVIKDLDGGSLSKVLEVTSKVNSESEGEGISYDGKWHELGAATNPNGDNLGSVYVTVALPEEVETNMKESCTVSFAVEAIQGNVNTDNIVEVTPENANETLLHTQTGKVYKLSAGEYSSGAFYPSGDAGVSFIGEPGVVFTGDLTVGYHMGQGSCSGDVIVSGITVKGDLRVNSKGDKTVVKNCTANGLTIATFGKNTVIDVKDNVIGSETAQGVGNGYALYIVPEETYTLNVTGNTFEGCPSHCIAVQASGQGGSNTSANGITVRGNNFNKWGINATKARAAFKIWGDEIYAPKENAPLTKAMEALADKIISDNTFEGYTTNSNNVYIEADRTVKGRG